MEVQMWPLDRVVVADRARKDLGDLSGLKDSMTALGQLQPISAQPDGTLVFGERRLTAARELGWTEIAVWPYTAESESDILRAEQDENTCRLKLAPVEAARLRNRIAEALRPEARRRMTAGVIQPGSNLEQGSKTRDRAARATGYGASSLDKVDEVLEAAKDDDPEIREEAEKQIENLSQSGATVDPAHKAVKQVRTRVQRKRTHDRPLGPGQVLQQPKLPPPVFPLERRLTDGINKGQGLVALADEIQDRSDLDLTDGTIRALRKRLKDETAERNRLHAALGSVLTKRKASS